MNTPDSKLAEATPAGYAWLKQHFDLPDSKLTEATPAGYAWLKQHFDLKVLPHFHESYIVKRGIRRSSEKEGGMIKKVFTKTYAPDPTPLGHMEFALKYDGVNLEILKAAFAKIPEQEVTKYILNKPTGRYRKKIWFLFEFLTNRLLDIPDLGRSNYVDVLEEEQYYTAKQVQSRRHRVNDNLLGGAAFCPIVRRTPRLKEWEEKKLESKIREILGKYPEDIQQRARGNSHVAETRSSYKIENESSRGDSQRRFTKLTKEAGTRPFFTKHALIELQNSIVDAKSKFRVDDYRDRQVYVSAQTPTTEGAMKLIPPKPVDVPELMEGMYSCFHRLMDPSVHPVVAAAVISYGFVYIHPFPDANGRISRFLIHDVLARREFTPEGLCVEVSTIMDGESERYQESLNYFSKPLVELTEWRLDSDGYMTATNVMADYFRYIDFTKIAEQLFGFIDKTLNTKFIENLNNLKSYELARRSIRDVRDGLGDKEDLLVKFLHQENWRLSAKKRKKFFPELTDSDVAEIERNVRDAFTDEDDKTDL